MNLRTKVSFLLPLLLILSVGIACAVMAHRSSLDPGTRIVLAGALLAIGTMLALAQGIVLATYLRRDQELRDGAAVLEQRVRELTHEIEQARQTLADAKPAAATGKTPASVTHELKNSLNGLGMAIELILEDPSNTARVDRLRGQVTSELGRLRAAVDSLRE